MRHVSLFSLVFVLFTTACGANSTKSLDVSYINENGVLQAVVPLSDALNKVPVTGSEEDKIFIDMLRDMIQLTSAESIRFELTKDVKEGRLHFAVSSRITSAFRFEVVDTGELDAGMLSNDNIHKYPRVPVMLTNRDALGTLSSNEAMVELAHEYARYEQLKRHPGEELKFQGQALGSLMTCVGSLEIEKRAFTVSCPLARSWGLRPTFDNVCAALSLGNGFTEAYMTFNPAFGDACSGALRIFKEE